MAQGSFNLRAIISLVDRISGPLQKITGSLSTLGSSFAAVGAAGAAIGGAGIAKVVETSAEFEKFQAILETIEGSSEKAKASMAWVTDFAQKTPYELAEVTDAFVKLKAYGIDAQKGALAASGNAAAALGKSLDQAAEALADALTGENERLKEFGIKAETAGNKITYRWSENGKKMKAVADKNNPQMIEKVVSGIWNRRYGGAMEKLSKTWTGMWSNLQDSVSGFWKMIGDAGFFDFAKAGLQDLLDLFAKWKQNGSLQDIANIISIELVKAGQDLRDWVTAIDWRKLIDGARDTWTAIQSGVEQIGGWKMVFAAFALFMAGPFLASLLAVAGAVVSLGVVLSSSPIGLLLAAIAGAGYLIYKNWAKVVPWFRGLWQQMVGLFRAFGTFLRAWATGDMAQVRQAFAALWDGLGSFFTTLFRGVRAAITAAVVEIGRVLGAWGPEQVEAAWNNLPIWAGILWTEIKSRFVQGVTIIGAILGGLAKGSVLLAFDGLSALAAATWDAIGGGAERLANSIRGWLGETLTQPLQRAWDDFAGGFLALWDNIEQRIRQVVDTIRGWINDVLALAGQLRGLLDRGWNGLTGLLPGSFSGGGANDDRPAARPSPVAAPGGAAATASGRLLTAAAGSAKVDGEVRIKVDAPPGTAVAATGSGGIDLPVDLGTRSLAMGY